MEIVNKPDIQVFASEAKTGEILKFPDVLRGWGVTLDQTQGKPPLEWMNDAFNRIDLNNLYLLQQGLPEWSSSTRYPVNAIVKHEGKIYLCILENKDYEPSNASDRWSLLIKAASEKDAGIAKIATQAEVDIGNNDSSFVTPKKLKGFIVNSPLTVGYNPIFQYEAGDIVRVNGIYYECYHPGGCKGIDPTNPVNRPSGWSSADVHAPYYWVEIGKYLMLPEVGSPQPIATMQIREGLIKYRNDAQLSATKFWRIAEQNPNLVKNGFIEISDLRANVIRGLDDGKGSDPNRVINSFQEDMIKSHAHWLQDVGTQPKESFTDLRTGGWAPDAPRYAQTSFEGGIETRMKNIAMYYCCRI